MHQETWIFPDLTDIPVWPDWSDFRPIIIPDCQNHSQTVVSETTYSQFIRTSWCSSISDTAGYHYYRMTCFSNITSFTGYQPFRITWLSSISTHTGLQFCQDFITISFIRQIINTDMQPNWSVRHISKIKHSDTQPIWSCRHSTATELCHCHVVGQII